MIISELKMNFREFDKLKIGWTVAEVNHNHNQPHKMKCCLLSIVYQPYQADQTWQPTMSNNSNNNGR